jgi:hypothetical protein
MKIYIIENGNLEKTGLIFWYDKKAFKSKKDSLFYIKNSFDVNKGTNKIENECIFDDKVNFITYDCFSTDNREMKVFLKITEIKTYY